MDKVYITKYALTAGPFEVEGEIHYFKMVSWTTLGGYGQHAHGKDFWLTKEEALADCERRRETKLKSLDKQRKKLEKMEFKL